MLVFELSAGVLVVGEESGRWRGQPVWPALQKLPRINEQGGEVKLAAPELPGRFKDCFWSNRKASFYIDGREVFSGVVKSEPEQKGHSLKLRIAKPIQQTIRVPGYMPIDSEAHPTAADIGVVPAEIFGEHADVPLLNTQTPAHTALTQAAAIGDKQLHVQVTENFPASGAVMVDEQVYAYTQRTETTLQGVTVKAPHQQGTLVAMQGETHYIACGHTCAIDQVRADGQSIDNASTEHQRVICSSLPRRREDAGLYTAQLQFDAVHADNTATDAVHAIQAVTAQDNAVQASNAPLTFGTGDVELERNEKLFFPAPSQDRILYAAYTVESEVTTDFAGDAAVFIGGQLAWMMTAGQIVWQASPLTFENTQDGNSISLQIKRNRPGAAINVTVTGAARDLLLGNLDNNAFARLANGEKLAVEQTTETPDYGRISKAELVIEWAPTDALQGAADVQFSGVDIGQLTAQLEAGQTTDYVISTDVVSQGQATLQNREVGGILSKTAQIQNSPTIERVSYPLSYQLDASNGIVYRSALSITPPKMALTGQHTVWLHSGDGQYGNTINLTDSSSRGVTLAKNAAKSSYFSINHSSVQCRFENSIIKDLYEADSYQKTVRPHTLEIEWRIDPIGVSGGGFTGTPSVSSGKSSISGITTRTRVNGGSGGITVTTPARAKTLLNRFPLDVQKWSDLDNKVASIEYQGGGAEQLNIFKVWLVVEYNAQRYVAANQITARVKDTRKNPVDILADLYSRSGKKLHWRCHQIAEWFAAQNWYFARRIVQPEELQRLISTALEQAGLMAIDTDQGIWLQRLDDMNCKRWENVDGDLLDEPTIKLRRPEDAINHLTVKSGDLVINRTPENNRWAQQGYQQSLMHRPLEYTARWISDVHALGLFAEHLIKRRALLRKETTIALPKQPYPGISRGHLVHCLGIWWRIMNISYSNTELTLELEACE